MGQQGGKERLCAKHSFAPPDLISVFFCPVLYETILAPLPSGSWLDGANGGGPPEVRGRKWCEVRICSACSLPTWSRTGQWRHSATLRMQGRSDSCFFHSCSSECTPGDLHLPFTSQCLSSFGSLNPAHPTHKTHWVIHLFPTRVDAGYM